MGRHLSRGEAKAAREALGRRPTPEQTFREPGASRVRLTADEREWLRKDAERRGGTEDGASRERYVARARR